MTRELRDALHRGMVIPALPLALTHSRRLDCRRQRALCRYYLAAGAGGLAVGVHTTQFGIRDSGLYKPVLQLAMEEMQKPNREEAFVKIAGICGPLAQAAQEANVAKELGYDVGLLSMGGLDDQGEDELLARAEAIASILPVFGFYLQPSVGGRILSYAFWRRFVEIPQVYAIKIAPFHRYFTQDVVRAVCESSRRDDIALYTGNDDNIVVDLLTPYQFVVDGRPVRKYIVGGLLGHWAVWTKKAVELLDEVRLARARGCIPPELLQRSVEITDANAAIFDPANGFAGCIPGIHEVLRRQGLLEGIWCLNSQETLSDGQLDEIDRVHRAYPHLRDDHFVREHLDQWLSDQSEGKELDRDH